MKKLNLLFASTILLGTVASPNIDSSSFKPNFFTGSARAQALDDIKKSDSNQDKQPLSDQDKMLQDSQETYRMLTIFGNVFERIRSDYVDTVKPKDLIENALRGMLTGLDAHSDYMNEQQARDMQIQTRGEFGGLGIEVTTESGLVKVVSPIDDTPAARAGIKPGDLITMIDEQAVLGLTLNEAVDRMRGKVNTEVKLTIKREGVDTPIIAVLKREVIHVQTVKSRLEEDSIGYIRLTQFNASSGSAVQEAFTRLKEQSGNKLKGVILDLRNDPGGLLDQAVKVSDSFLKSGEIVSIRGRKPNEDRKWQATSSDITNGLPIVILINGGSASASEIVAGALQDNHRAIVLGKKSFGKGSVQTIIPITAKTAMRLTTARYYTPSGKSIQGMGITPDVEVAATREEKPRFLPEHEADLRRALVNKDQAKPSVRDDLPEFLKDIPKLPPIGAEEFNLAKPSTDFQLQQAIVVLNKLSATKEKPKE